MAKYIAVKTKSINTEETLNNIIPTGFNFTALSGGDVLNLTVTDNVSKLSFDTISINLSWTELELSNSPDLILKSAIDSMILDLK